MTDSTRSDIGKWWVAGATTLLLAVGGLIYQVKGLSEDVQDIREKGSPVLKARVDVIESVALGQQRQIDAMTLEVRSELKEIRRLLEEHVKEKKP